MKYLLTARVNANTHIAPFSNRFEKTVDHTRYFGVNDPCRDGQACDPPIRAHEERTFGLIRPPTSFFIDSTNRSYYNGRNELDSSVRTMKAGTFFRMFQAKDGREGTLRAPRWSDLDDMLEFINALVDEGVEITVNRKMTRDKEVD